MLNEKQTEVLWPSFGEDCFLNVAHKGHVKAEVGQYGGTEVGQALVTVKSMSTV